MKLYARRTARAACLTALAWLTSHAGATESFDLRYAPGNGGSDMTAPLEPGWYVQMPLYIYNGKLALDPVNSVIPAQGLFTGSVAGLAAVFPTATATTPIAREINVNVKALVPRVTFMGVQEFMGATVGFTAMVRLIEKHVTADAAVGATTVANVDPSTLATATGGALTLPALTAKTNAAVANSAQAQAQSLSGKNLGFGDVELAPLLRWNIDPAQILFAPTIVLPTGQYDANRIGNPGSGNFYTFRPLIQYGYIAEGWDFGARAAFSINTKNQDTNYRSGNYLNVDIAWMKSFFETLRLGVNGYAVVQTTKDTCEGTPTALQALTVGKRAQVFGAGPSIAWIKGSGDFLMEARAYKEFSAENRPEGTSVWLSVSMPL